MAKKSKIRNAHEYPSVQSFYQREIPTDKSAVEPDPAIPGDGFTEEELADALDPLNRKWDPEREYEGLTIENLVPGPRAVAFAGRVVNLNTYFGHSPKQPKAAGFHSLIIKDDSAAILIKLYFARNPYPLKIGQLMSLWTAFVSNASKQGNSIISGVKIAANMFPGRVTSDHVMIHTNGSSDSICRTPLEYQKGRQLPGLMTLESWLSSGHDGVINAKILVCVKSIGRKKTITRKDGVKMDLVDVGLFDHTGEVNLTIWSGMIESMGDWKAGTTILLISNPGYKVAYTGKGTAGVTHQTMIDVEPDLPDAEWLRKHAQGLTKRESLCLEFPEGLWDVDDVERGVYRPLFTLAELDRWVRAGSNMFSGFLNLTIMDMSLVSVHRRNMLMCSECCGVPVYANSLTLSCRNCNKIVNLALNPKIIGALMDETGCLQASKLLWHPRVWEQVFGRTIKEVLVMTNEDVRWFEQRVLYMRMHLSFGWEESIGRLAIISMLP